MIDFPTLYPNLVKYLPNWLERFYPSLAQFARGEGYPCGNQGVFIPRRNKCWTHPKTGTRLKKPLTYQMYKDAKEKSQKSRTEKGRAALETREQGFRDKAREKVKGWQKNKPQSETTQTEVKPGDNVDINKSKTQELLDTIEKARSEQRAKKLTEIKGISSNNVVIVYDKKDEKGNIVGTKVVDQGEQYPPSKEGKPTKKELNDQFKRGAQRIEVNNSEGFVKTPNGDIYEVTKNSRLAKKLDKDPEVQQEVKKTDKDIESQQVIKKGAGAKYLEDPTTNKWMKTHEGLKEIARAMDEDSGFVDTGERGRNDSDATYKNGVVKVFRLNKPSKSDVYGTASILSPYGERTVISLPLLADGVKGELVKKGQLKQKPQEEPKPTPNSTEGKGAIAKSETQPKELAPPTPKLKSKDHFANDKYDKWLISESQKLEGKEKNYNIRTESGKKSVKGKVYENFGIHEDRGRYNLTQLSSGRMLNRYDDEDLAKKAIIELNRSGIDWKLNEEELQNVPGIQSKMKSVKRKVDAVIESDKRVKSQIESMMADQNKDYGFDWSEELAALGVKNIPKKKKNDFNAHLKLAQFAKPTSASFGCCCEASKPLRRRKSKQTPKLRRRGNRYA